MLNCSLWETHYGFDSENIGCFCLFFTRSCDIVSVFCTWYFRVGLCLTDGTFSLNHRHTHQYKGKIFWVNGQFISTLKQFTEFQIFNRNFVKRKMKILQTVRSDFLVLGLDPYPTNRLRPFNSKNILRLSLLTYGLISFTIYLYKIANSFEEYTKCIFVLTTLLDTLLIFWMMIWKSRQFFEYFDKMERKIDKSKKWKLLLFN